MRLRTGVSAGSIGAIIAIVLIMTGGWAFSQTRSDSRTSLAQALDTAPADARVAGFTDWAGIRRVLGFAKIRSAIDRNSLVDNSFKRNFSGRSVMQPLADQMHEAYGWSIADLRWEMFAQGTSGEVLSAGLDGGLRSSTVTKGLTSLGYRRSDGIWAITTDALSSALPGFPSAFTYAAYYPRQKLILFSDTLAYLQRIVTMHRDNGRTLAGVAAARMTAAPLVGSLSAVISDDIASCEATGLSGEPADVRAQARNLVAPLGKLSAYSYAGRAIFDDGDDAHLRFTMAFGTAAKASHQLALRRQLTKGPFIGRTGRLQDVLRLRSTSLDGPVASLDFGFDADKAAFMNGQGPLLFTACSA